MSQAEKLRSASAGQLFLAEMRWTALRNFEIVLGVIAAGVILLAGWSLWLLVIPAILAHEAAANQFGIVAVRQERSRRTA